MREEGWWRREGMVCVEFGEDGGGERMVRDLRIRVIRRRLWE